MTLVCHALALGLAFALGSPWWALALGALAFAGSSVTRSIVQVALLLAGAVALLGSARGIDLVTLEGALAVLLALACLAPLVIALGPGAPEPRAYLIAGGAIAAAAGSVLLPQGLLLAHSDLALGATIVALAAGAMLAASLSRPSEA